ncbi:MAG: hypothetical protein KAU31_08110 [Spirochaetaceae bacterium]|nr:hypothetical protein [Spirochaetaceae bacterium]
MKLSRALLFLTAAVAIAAVLAACGGGGTASSTKRMRLDVTSATSRGTITEGSITISGVISEPTATVTVNEKTVPIESDGSFSEEVELVYGSNRIQITAEADGFVTANRTISVTRALKLTVETPENDLDVPGTRVTVAGTVSDPTAEVRVNGRPVAVEMNGNYSHELVLYYPLTIISVIAGVEGMAPISQNITVTSSSLQ